MIIIGITGTLGAGKGTLVDYLVTQKGFMHYSVRSFLIREIDKRQMQVNRDSMVVMANELRKNNGSSYIVDCLYDEACRNSRNAVIESIRTVGEVESLRRKGNFYLLAVDALAEIRYRRIILRNSETDHVTLDEFLENEQREMNSSDPNKQSLSGCISLADFLFYNNGSREELYAQLEKVLPKTD
ncbi:MAG: AAA family ATPase [Bacteroidales bacterium]|jgi:dephospho-CoA kinase|nr:AAA family ATPase [Bacteroidales bacterium]